MTEENIEIASNMEGNDSDIRSLKTMNQEESNNEDVDIAASTDDKESYSKHLMYAEEMYNSGNFGRAIVEYSDIIKIYTSF